MDRDALTMWLAPIGMTARFERFDLRPGGSYRLVLTYGAPVDSAKSSADTDIVEARFVDIVHGERDVVAADVPDGISVDDHAAGMASSLENLASYVEWQPPGRAERHAAPTRATLGVVRSNLPARAITSVISRRPDLPGLARVLGLAAFLAACGGGDGGGADAEVQFLPSSVQGITVLDGTRPVAWARDLAHETAVAYELCASEGCSEITLIGLGGDAVDVVAVDSALWVAPGTGDGPVRIVDPAGGVTTVGPSLPTPVRIAAGGEAVFVASVFDLYRFDRADPTAEAVSIVWSAASQSVAAIVAMPDAAWVLGHAGEVARVDATTMEVTARGEVTGSVASAGSVAVGPDGLYVATTDSGVDVVVRLDPDTLEVTARVELADDVIEAAVSVAGDRVIVATGPEVLELDPITLDRLDGHRTGSALAVGVSVIDERVWVASPLSVTVIAR